MLIFSQGNIGSNGSSFSKKAMMAYCGSKIKTLKIF